MNYPDSIYKKVEELHWLNLANDGVLEIFLDNHVMQTLRMCEAAFTEQFIEGYKGRDSFWFLDFGTVMHKAIENYYINRKKPNFDLIKWATSDIKELWESKNLDQHSEHPGFKDLGGLAGATGLLLQYAQYFNQENERFRVIGSELYFGKNKEVPLLENHEQFSFAPFRLYLAGKIDLLVDDGRSIGPMDHKTARDFRGKNPAVNYEIQDGMTGYVFAAKSILKQIMDTETGPKGKYPTDCVIEHSRICNKIWMNFLQVKPTKTMDERFKRIPLYKSDWELEQYRLRQISTVSRIYQFLAEPELQPYYNTMACTNYMHNVCPFFSAHKQKDRDSQLLILNADFSKDVSGIWNPENIKD